MTKDEALKMAIEFTSPHPKGTRVLLASTVNKACKEALELSEKQHTISDKEQPAPSWQGLSDDEIQDAWYKLYPLDKNNLWADMMFGKHLDKFARAIEQALKEKNNGNS